MSTVEQTTELSPLTQVNDLVYELARVNIVEGKYRDILGKKDFPGEGRISHYEMCFALNGSSFTREEKALYGRSATPGIRVIKIRKSEMGTLLPGFDVVLQRIVLKNDQIDPSVSNLYLNEITADLSTGEMYLRKFIDRTTDIGVVSEELKLMMNDLHMKGTRLVSAAFTDSNTGLRHNKIIPEITPAEVETAQL